tara:strand:+ start:29063 stop:29200 length:138 start_codon:yes stop_codon:yes gene_type:complete
MKLLQTFLTEFHANSVKIRGRHLCIERDKSATVADDKKYVSTTIP